MYRALYRKWRPKDFDEVCGQEQVTHILKYQVSEGKTSHAYLFCGSRGTGKTSCAKILAKAVNCLHPVSGNPCHVCEACQKIEQGIAVDVIEMDAASNNGVDDVRDMKEEISFTPAELKYRVYIIDEVHMMSTSAFNALLKTLEEPPAHVLFILATTELHKLPATIVSRCQRFDFRRLTTSQLMARLSYIAQEEGISLTEDGARAIARMSRGGMRDAISLLELCGSTAKTVDSALVADLLGSGSKDDAYKMLEAVAKKEYSTVFSIIDEAEQIGNDIGVFWQTLGDVWRELLVVSVLPEAQSYLDLTDFEYQKLKSLTELLPQGTVLRQSKIIEDTTFLMQRQGASKRMLAEMALLRMCDSRLSKDAESLLSRIEALEREVALLRIGGASTPTEPKQPEKKVSAPVVENRPAPTPPPSPAPAPAKPASPAPKAAKPVSLAEQGMRPVKNWREVLATFETVKPHFASVLRQVRAALTAEGKLCLTIKRDVMGDMMLRDEATMKLLLSLTSEVDPTCNPTLGYAVIDMAPQGDSDPFSF